ncbi:redoxin domain-containing protein [Mycobacterium kansasii]|uniref:Soluble secreted antigen MPT53 n=3 Tax=Mycobacterium kansasii TaxID=1768 RepID=A0A1V3X961_MYCKA|nr:redoxin domain-containing protein [Mycobacterium kansasii]AGZ50916.1 lipoprotein DsbF [Mycobacterium kansasii ATCC 12478]ARG62809.1 thiol:disulfide interchange protein [Mycobacterium kansasii]ARG70425.1 thiol:disulfide interchange protein [Mycobacterium kansasii]ARG77461.1 thiol:disulfide interchange protein [Mycobacterium kansasii]ARG80455.1 thiol:disulfide interchange protein [Mycobacterium kansasii]
MPRHLIASLAVAAAAATIVTACGSSGARSDPANTPASSSSRPAGPSARVPAQLQFTAKTIDGHTFSGDSLAGRAVVLWFWTPWCPKCQHEAPIAADVAAAHPRVTFVGVAARDQVSAMQGFVDKYQLSGFTQLADTDGVVWTRFGVTQQPAWAFVSANGDVDVVKGSLTQSELNERVDGLVSR